MLTLLCCFAGFSQVKINDGTPVPVYDNSNVNTLVTTMLGSTNSCLVRPANARLADGVTPAPSRYSDGRGLGTFTNTGTSAFPFASGVVLVTGNARLASGPNYNSPPLNDTGVTAQDWLGDTDLETAVRPALGASFRSRNAAVLEFDFTAVSTSISIPYIFASEEYGAYKCRSKDAMAILIRQTGSTAPYTNIAVLPDGNPVSVATIRTENYGTGTCAAVNPSLFRVYNAGSDAVAQSAATAFEGETVVLTANYTGLTPGVQYHIKIVIADDGNANNLQDGTDTNGNSGVFFPAGGVDLGQNVLPDNLTVANNTALCAVAGASYRIETGLPAANYTFSWTTTTNPAVIGTGAFLDVSASGTYVVAITDNAASCTSTQQVQVEFAPPPVAGTPANIYSCPNGAGVFTYNLNVNNTALLNGNTQATVTYYATLAAAQQGTGTPLSSTYTTSVTTTTTIFARIKSNNSSCYVTASFDLIPVAAPTASTAANLVSCETAAGSNTSIFNLTQNTAAILGSQNMADYNVAYFASLAEANAGTPAITSPNSYSYNATTGGSSTATIYARVQSVRNTACYTTTSFTIRVSQLPAVSTLSDIQVCGSYTLPAITDGTYWTAPGGATGTGTQITTSTPITTTQNIYIYNTNTDGCFNQSQFRVEVLTAVPVPPSVTACDTYTLPALPNGHQYRDAPNCGGNIIAAGSAITSTQTIYYCIPTAATCSTASASFTVTIVKADSFPDQNLCYGATYTLPTLSAGNSYWSAAGGPSGGGTRLNSPITATTRVYVYAPNSTGTCASESHFDVTIQPLISNLTDRSVCGGYTLPALTFGAYYEQAGGAGAPFTATSFGTTKTLWAYYRDPVTGCTQDVRFTITVVARPTLANIPNVVSCGAYTLPANSNVVAYYTGSNMTGTAYTAGQSINATTTLYAVTAPSAPGCYTQRQFTVTIINRNISIPNVTRCDEYFLPTLDFGDYLYNPGAPSTSNPVVPAGTRIPATTRIYVYQSFTTGGTPCVGTGDFLVTINPKPAVSTMSNVIACNSYTLPALPAGQTYRTATGGGGTALAANTAVTTSQTIYIYAVNTATSCDNESNFRVDIIDSSALPTSVRVCGSYTFPAVSVGGYYSAPNGGGTRYTAGSTITTTPAGPVYYYAAVTTGTNCTDVPFTVTIDTRPTITNYPDVTACNSYILPALAAGETYYSQPNGLGTVIPVGTPITTDTSVFPYASSTGGATGCDAYDEIHITILPLTLTSLPNQTVCENIGFTLPQTEIISGAIVGFYEFPGGRSNPSNVIELQPNDVINRNLTVYEYAYLTATPTCFTETSFTVTAIPSPAIDITTVDPDGDGIIAVCGSYQLPAYPTVTPVTPGMTVGYYTQPDGAGTQLFPGQTLSSSMPVYVYVRSGGTPNCSAEAILQIFVNPTPPVVDPACDSVTLPTLPIGQEYWSGPGGTGTQYANGAVLPSSQPVYFYVPAAAACTSGTFFNVTVFHTPTVTAPSSPQVHCDVYVLPTLAVGNYYSGPNRTGTAYNAGDRITSSMTMYVYADTSTVPNCVSQDSFNIQITPTPATIAFSNVDYCDAYTLPTLPAGYHYYSQTGGPLASGQVETAGGTVVTTNAGPTGTKFYIYAEAAANTACFTETSFNVMIYSASVDTEISRLASDADALAGTWAQTYTTSGNADPSLNGLLSVHVETCDSYTLPNLNIGGTSPTDVYVQHYYVLPGGPNATGQQVITNLVMDASHPQYNATTGTVTLYLYRILNGRLDCHDESIIDVKINTTPLLATAPANVTDCDTTTLPALGSGFAYYSQTGGRGPLASLTLTSSQTVYAYAQTGTNQICSTEYPFTVTINRIDIPRPADVVACDQYVLPVAVPATARYFQFAGGPGTSNVEYPVGHIFLPGTYTVYLWDHTNTLPDCIDQEQFVVRVIARPTPITPSAVETCSVDDAGLHGYFDLTTALTQAVGGQANVTATAFETQADADFNVRPITAVSNYYNLNGNTQQLIIRVESTLTGGCYITVPLQLIVHPRPIAVDPLPDYQICDNGVNDNDGIGEFDLTTYIPQVLGTLSPATHTVTFYETQADLDAGGPSIATPGTYNTVTRTVFIKVTINATGCYDVVPLELIVNPKPVVNMPAALTLCDVNNPGDEKEFFDLTTKINEITGGVLGLNVTFHTLLVDAEGGNSPILTPTAYENVVRGVQPIFVRVTNAVTGCYRVVLLDIRVEPLPILLPLTLQERTVCSTNNQGYGVFDLDQMAIEMIDGAPNVTVTWYPTLVSAQLGINVITNTSNYQNINPFAETIYAVPQNTVTGCKGTPVPVMLIINEAPADVLLQPITVCDDTDNDDQDDTYQFNLTQQNTAILAQLDPTRTYVISYFANELDARAGSPVIVNPTSYTGHDGNIIWVRIEYPISGCFIVTSFKLILNKPQELAHPATLIVCDDAVSTAMSAIFDLTLREDEILTPTGIGEGNVVTYYEVEADRDSGAANFIPDPTQYRNTVNPQNIYVRVVTPQGCVSEESMLIMVAPVPTPRTPQTLEECDVVSSSDPEGYHAFDLTLAAADVRGGDTLSQIHYYANLADYAAGVEIANPSSYVNTVQWNDTVIVSLSRTNPMPGSPTCSAYVTLNIKVNPLPPVYNPATGGINFYAICNPLSTGYEQFNLIGHINDQLTANGVVPTDYYIRFYASAAAEAAGTALPHLYTNTTQYQEPIWVVVRNIATGCTIKGTMMLYAEQAAVANPIVTNNPLRTCDIDPYTGGNNDGVTDIDLTRVASEVLGTQSATQFSLEYYTSQAAAITGDITSADYVATPAAYNAGPSGTIWVRITNTATNAPCFDVTNFNYVVDLLPEPIVSSLTGDTVCKNFETGAVDGVELWSGVSGTGYTYQWFLGGTAITTGTAEFYTALEAGMYTVVVTSPEGCVSVASDAFEILLSGPAAPAVGSGYVISNAFGDNQTLTVLVEGYGEYQYSIAPGNEEATGPWQNSNVFENMPIGYYTIYIRDVKTDYPCAMVSISDVSVVDYPKFFTPNGDGYNDYWNIVGMANEQYADARILIFDRYGKLIKQLSPQSRPDEGEGWDGTFNGKPVPSDDYWFLVEFTENNVKREFRGHFALKR